MKSSRWLWLLAVPCLLLFAASAWANGSQEQAGTAGSTASGNEPVTLTMWNSEVPTAGIQQNDVAKEIARITGVTLNIVQGDAQKFKVLVAGNDLPDIIYTNPAQQQVAPSTLIDGGQVIALDDLINAYGTNIKKNFPERLQYSKSFLSNGKNKTYWLPVNSYRGDPNKPNVNYTIGGVGNMIRWDIYAKIGYPEIQTSDDFLKVLRQMLDAYPTTEEGKTVYGISGWSDWGIWPWFVSNTQENAQYGFSNDVLFNRATGESTISYNDPKFWDSVSFFNKASRMGLLDTEAFTMKADNFWQKAQNGQVLMAYASWQTNWINQYFVSSGHPERGFEKVPIDGNPYVEGIVSPDAPLGKGQDYANAITANCKLPVRAIKLLDFFNSDAGARLIYSGIKGTHWEIVNGVAKPTADFLKSVLSDPNYRTKAGTTLYNKSSFAADIQVLGDGFPADLMQSNDQKAANVLPIDKQYTDYWGKKLSKAYAFPGQVLLDLWKQGKIKTFTKFWLFPLLVQEPSDEIKRTIAQIDEYMKVQIPRAILTTTDADYAAQKAKIMQDIKAMGFDKAEAAILDTYKTAAQQASKLAIQ